MQWPDRGNETVFRRLLTTGALLVGCLAAGVGLTLASIRVADTMIAVSMAGMVLVLAMAWVAARAQRSARRSEIVRSFAGMCILHQGSSILIDEKPLLGEYATRRDAAWAAARCGHWAVLVHAYGRYYVLTGAKDQDQRPISFRSRAVADVVPALFDEAISA